LIHGDFHSGDVSLEKHNDILADDILTCSGRYGSRSQISGQDGPRTSSTEVTAYTLSICRAAAGPACLLPTSCLANCCRKRSI
jgi:hypothetical protein